MPAPPSLVADPAAAAISMTAVASSGSQPQRARTGSPSAPRTVVSRHWPPVAASTAWTVPSPPSAIGMHRVWAPGQACRTPRAMAAAASGADRLSLNESGAMTIFTMVRLLARQGERL
ncbi:Uncharacterised protein [Bordetella pertussis]|nr:Uncharacterised protein [Bordetella pertussis]